MCKRNERKASLPAARPRNSGRSPGPYRPSTAFSHAVVKLLGFRVSCLGLRVDFDFCLGETEIAGGDNPTAEGPASGAPESQRLTASFSPGILSFLYFLRLCSSWWNSAFRCAMARPTPALLLAVGLLLLVPLLGTHKGGLTSFAAAAAGDGGRQMGQGPKGPSGSSGSGRGSGGESGDSGDSSDDAESSSSKDQKVK